MESWFQALKPVAKRSIGIRGLHGNWAKGFLEVGDGVEVQLALLRTTKNPGLPNE